MKDKYLVNEKIVAKRVKLIDQDGKMLGLFLTVDALTKAKQEGLDLVEINSKGNPPIAKLMDYGKFKYEMRIKEKENRKKNKVRIKQITMKPNISDHDLDIKIRHANEFLSKNQKVQFIIRLKGREISHSDLHKELLEKIKDRLENYTVEKEPDFKTRMIMMLVSPNNK